MNTLPSIVILTGSGVSADSGIPTFRGPDGLWEGHLPEQVATPEAFAADPALVHRFYNARRAALLKFEPNEAHLALARLQRDYPAPITLVTQNVDDLHERAGSPEVIHMHGELLKTRCTACGTVEPWTRDLNGETTCPTCTATGSLRPHVVWFGEMPFDLDRIGRALERTHLFAAIGTSGLVYPAAGFVGMAREFGARTLEFNLEPTASALFDERHPGRAVETIPRWVDSLLEA